MRRRNVIAVGIFVLFYVAFGVFLTHNQESVIYQPPTQDFTNCPALPEAKLVTHQGTRLYVHDSKKPVVVHYHGNAESACSSSVYAQFYKNAGYGYVLVEYAGYSNDPRATTHELVKADARNMISYLRENDVRDVTIVGQSIGTGVAAYHTALAPPEKLLLISPFTDLATVARQRFWFYPTSLLVDNAFATVANLETYKGQVTIIHGTDDSLIPYQLGQELFESLYTEKKLVPISGAGHNDLFAKKEFFTALEDFLNY